MSKGVFSKEQIETVLCSTAEIMHSPYFARGLDDIRAGRAFADGIDDWSYERGRLFGCIAPRSMPLFIGKQLNPKAVALFDAAYDRGLIR